MCVLICGGELYKGSAHIQMVVSYVNYVNIYIYIYIYIFYFFIYAFLSRTMTTHAESINSDIQRGLDRHLRHTQH